MSAGTPPPAGTSPSAGATGTAPPPLGHNLLPRHVVQRPKRLLDPFLDYHLNNGPDITDLTIDHPSLQPMRLQNWRKPELCRGMRERRRPHNDLPGLCAQMYLGSLDFTMQCNKWAVRFKNDDDGKWTDMTDEFITTVWCAYVARMVGLTYVCHMDTYV